LRVAKEILGGIELILHHQERGNVEYNVALFCYNAARKIRDQQQAALDRLRQRRSVVGAYVKKKKMMASIHNGPSLAS
jgi:hypothetical protein